jgi:hypothetical protein
MSTVAQLFLIVVISVLTFFAVVAGIQVFQILYEFRMLLKKINRIADHTESLSTSAAKPVSAVNEFFNDLHSLAVQIPEESSASLPDKVITPASDKTLHRFFHRSSLPIHPS